jgi:uncharacterized protein (TIGR00255 family)
MYYSMTGYGSSAVQLQNKTLAVEIKSLNSKGLDMNLRLPSALKSYELEIRSTASEQLVRGKADITVSINYDTDFSPVQINKTLLSNYLKQLTDIAEENAITAPDLLSVAMRIPNIMESNDDVITEAEWADAKKCVAESIAKLIGFRKDEGAKLKTDILSRITLIADYTLEVEKTDIARMQKMKDRLKEQVADVSGSASFNADRFEQEIIYYLEKMDITEELVRLKTHCDYFTEISNDKAIEKGKKLGFVAQEIGREINTIGSKASDAQMQKIVVMMKDELEKIKEQLNNVL